MAGHAAAPEEPLSNDVGAASVTDAERVDAEGSDSTTQVDEEAIDGDGAESAPDTEGSPAPDADAEGTDSADSSDIAEADGEAGRKLRVRRLAPVRLALVFGVVAFVAVGTLSGWLGYRDYQSAKVDNQRHQFLQVARQGAINLTTIDWQESALVGFEHGYLKLELPAPLASNRPGRVEILRDPGNGVMPTTTIPTLPWVAAMHQQAINFVKAIKGN